MPLSQMVREFQVALQGPAGNGPAIARINAVISEATELYAARDADGHHRDLELFEELFISATNAITIGFSNARSQAHRTWGDGNAYDALRSLSYREQAAKLEAALASYKRAREEFYNEADDEALEVEAVVAAAMQEAAE